MVCLGGIGRIRVTYNEMEQVSQTNTKLNNSRK